GLAADVPNLNRGVSHDLALNFEIPILRVWRNAIVCGDALRAIARNRDRLERRGCELQIGRVGDRNVVVRLNIGEGCEVDRRVGDATAAVAEVHAWYCAEDAIYCDEVANRANVVDAVTGAKDGFLSAKPGQIPTQTNRGREIVQVASVGQNIGMRRVLPD